MLRLLVLTLVVLAGCFDGGGETPQPDAAPPPPPPPDAAPPPPPPPPLKGYGETCAGANECASGICIGETGSPFQCSRLCTLNVAQDCKDVDAFCAPIGNNQNACFGSIETLNDLDDAVLEIGDSATRALTPLGDADLFLVRQNQLGRTVFTVTPVSSVDVALEAYGAIGEPLAVANNVGASMAEQLQTDVQQVGTHVFIVVRNVGQSTGNFTLSIVHEENAIATPSF